MLMRFKGFFPKESAAAGATYLSICVHILQMHNIFTRVSFDVYVFSACQLNACYIIMFLFKSPI